MEIVIHHQDRSHTTGAEAPSDSEREETIRRCLAHVYSKLMFEGLKEFVPATDITSCPQTDTDEIGAAWNC